MAGLCWCGGQINVMSDPVSCLESKFHDPLATGRPTRVGTLYVAGPMSGYEDCNYPQFNEVSRVLEGVGYKTVNPSTVHVDRQHHYVDLIRADLKMMLDCDGVAVLENWWESAGARNEVQVAGLLKMPVRPWLEWIERAHQELNN